MQYNGGVRRPPLSAKRCRRLWVTHECRENAVDRQTGCRGTKPDRRDLAPIRNRGLKDCRGKIAPVNAGTRPGVLRGAQGAAVFGGPMRLYVLAPDLPVS